jgi:hypothetical protein
MLLLKVKKIRFLKVLIKYIMEKLLCHIYYKNNMYRWKVRRLIVTIRGKFVKWDEIKEYYGSI